MGKRTRSACGPIVLSRDANVPLIFAPTRVRVSGVAPFLSSAFQCFPIVRAVVPGALAPDRPPACPREQYLREARLYQLVLMGMWGHPLDHA